MGNKNFATRYDEVKSYRSGISGREGRKADVL